MTDHDDPQTAMLLTETEWDDLAAMVKHFRFCTEWADDSVPPSVYRRRVHANQIAALEENVADLRRKRSLAQRIIEACE